MRHMWPVQVGIEPDRVDRCHMLFVLSCFVLFRGRTLSTLWLVRTMLRVRRDSRHMLLRRGCRGTNQPNSRHMRWRRMKTELYQPSTRRTRLGLGRRWQSRENTRYMTTDRWRVQQNQGHMANTGAVLCRWRSVLVHSPSNSTVLSLRLLFLLRRLRMWTIPWFRRTDQQDIASTAASRPQTRTRPQSTEYRQQDQERNRIDQQDRPSKRWRRTETGTETRYRQHKQCCRSRSNSDPQYKESTQTNQEHLRRYQWHMEHMTRHHWMAERNQHNMEYMSQYRYWERMNQQHMVDRRVELVLL
jgi:hypothetical protein